MIVSADNINDHPNKKAYIYINYRIERSKAPINIYIRLNYNSLGLKRKWKKNKNIIMVTLSVNTV